MFKNPTFWIVVVVLIGLGALGGFLNNRREMASACANDVFVDFVRPEMIDSGRGRGYINQSIYFTALNAAVDSEQLAPELRPELEAELAQVQDDIANAPVLAREVSPSSGTELTCRYELMIGKTLIITRFNLSIEDMPGTEFQDNFERRRGSVVLLEELQPGVPVETVRVAKLGLRQTRLEEPAFTAGRFDQVYVPDVIIPAGVISEIPR